MGVKHQAAGVGRPALDRLPWAGLSSSACCLLACTGSADKCVVRCGRQSGRTSQQIWSVCDALGVGRAHYPRQGCVQAVAKVGAQLVVAGLHHQRLFREFGRPAQAGHMMTPPGSVCVWAACAVQPAALQLAVFWPTGSAAGTSRLLQTTPGLSVACLVVQLVGRLPAMWLHQAASIVFACSRSSRGCKGPTCSGGTGLTVCSGRQSQSTARRPGQPRVRRTCGCKAQGVPEGVWCRSGSGC